jgi:hypothetical protein
LGGGWWRGWWRVWFVGRLAVVGFGGLFVGVVGCVGVGVFAGWGVERLVAGVRVGLAGLVGDDFAVGEWLSYGRVLDECVGRWRGLALRGLLGPAWWLIAAAVGRESPL